MKISLLEVYSNKKQYINKDVMGGYGMVAKIGDSFRAKILERAKKKSVNIPVFALGYLSAILKNNGHEVQYKLNEIPRGAEIVLIPSSIVDFKHELEFADKIKKETNAKVGFFGPFSSVYPEMYLEHADFVITGEPEDAVKNIKDGFIPRGIVSGDRVSDLDDLPFPDWDMFPVENYSYKPVLKSKPFIPVLSSRGCAFSCLYCPYKAYYGHLRKRSVNSVINELKYLKEKYKINSVQFRDPLFTAERNRALEIAEKIISSGMKFEWGCETHVNCLDEDLIDKLYESGMRSVNLGIESEDADILKNASRASAPKKREVEIINYCHKKGINVAAFYIFGLPEDTKESILKTISYAKKLNTLVAQFFIFTPFPGTPYYDKMKNRIFENDFEKFDAFTPVFSHEKLQPKDLLELKEKAFVSYYFRPKYLMRHLKNLI